jgi:pyridoxine/pyridoxamine 5'-phosphate oxidase
MLISESNGLDEIWEIIQLELKKGPTAKRHPFRFVVLSTAKHGSVSSRWVVFRKFTEDLKLLIYTDGRSEKCTELKDNPNASLLFYHDRHKLQIRIDAKVSLHQQDELTAKYWPGVKGSKPNDYLTVLAPGGKISDKAKGYEHDPELDDQYFTILEFDPQKIEVLQLNGDRHLRAEFKKNQENWHSSFLVP